MPPLSCVLCLLHASAATDCNNRNGNRAYQNHTKMGWGCLAAIVHLALRGDAAHIAVCRFRPDDRSQLLLHLHANDAIGDAAHEVGGKVVRSERVRACRLFHQSPLRFLFEALGGIAARPARRLRKNDARV